MWSKKHRFVCQVMIEVVICIQVMIHRYVQERERGGREQATEVSFAAA